MARIPTNIAEFSELLSKSGLQNASQTGDCVEVFRAEKKGEEDVSAFCGFLVSTGRVTAWQCEKLKMGKWKGFYLDQYVVLEPIGAEHGASHKAKDTTTGDIVCLVLTGSVGGRLTYRIEHYSEK